MIEATWKGKPLSEHTKEELIKIIEHMNASSDRRNKHLKKYEDFISSTMGQMGSR